MNGQLLFSLLFLFGSNVMRLLLIQVKTPSLIPMILEEGLVTMLYPEISGNNTSHCQFCYRFTKAPIPCEVPRRSLPITISCHQSIMEGLTIRRLYISFQQVELWNNPFIFLAVKRSLQITLSVRPI